MSEEIFDKAIEPEREYERGMKHLKVYEYSLAVKCFEHDADRGDPDAMYRLGMMYYNGLGVEENIGQAVRLFELAAKKHNMYAQYRLGLIYLIGVGMDTYHETPAEYSERKKKSSGYFEKAVSGLIAAANAGETEAQTVLGDYYFIYADPQDAKKGAAWWSKAAASGDAQAQFSLGCCYAEGDGVEKNAELAKKWLETAAAQGHAGAVRELKKQV